MAKDDYDVIVYKILLYLYACTKRKIVFDHVTYDKAIGKTTIHEDYLNDIYRMMSDEGLIEELAFQKAWGNVIIPLFDESDLRITPTGIHYLTENDKMNKVGSFLKDKADSIAGLITMVGIEIVNRI